MDLEEIRKKRLEELQNQHLQQQNQALQEQIKLQQQLELVENVAKQYMTPEAISRYSNIKVAHSEKAIMAISWIAQGVQSGKIRHKLSDMEFKELLIQMTEPKKEFNITRR